MAVRPGGGRPAVHTVHLGAATLLRVSAEGLGTALVLIVQARTGQAATAGFLQTAMMLPYVLSGPITGHALDRTPRPRSLVLAMAACYVLAAGLLLAAAGRVPMVLALLVAAVVGCAEPVVVALTALLPRYVPPDLLTRAYGLEAATYNVAAIAGPGLAAVLAAAAGAGYAAAAVIASAVLALALLPLLAVPPPGQTPADPRSASPGTAREPTTPDPSGPGLTDSSSEEVGRESSPAVDSQVATARGTGVAADRGESALADSSGEVGWEPAVVAGPGEPAREEAGAVSSAAASAEAGRGGGRTPVLDVVVGGLVVLVMNPVLRAVTVATTMAFLGMGGIAVTAVLFAEHIGERADAGGQLIAAFAVGSLAGSLAAARWLSARWAEWVLVAGMVAFGTALAAIVAAPSLPWALAGFVVAGVFDGPVFAATLTVRQREAPADRLGQVNTTGGSLKIGSAALGAALTGVLADHVGATGLLLGMAALQLLGAVLGVLFLAGLRRRS